MTHEWKIGDWCELSGKRYLVARVERTGIYAVGYKVYSEAISPDVRNPNLIHLPDCTGWDWQPPKPIEPPKGYRLLAKNEMVRNWDMVRQRDGKWVELLGSKEEVSQHPAYSYARKIEPRVRPMTRAEFLAAWKQRGFCPLVSPDDEIDVVVMIVEELDHDMDCVNMYNAGWCSVDKLADYKFASDETYLTVEE